MGLASDQNSSSAYLEIAVNHAWCTAVFSRLLLVHWATGQSVCMPVMNELANLEDFKI